MTDEKQIIIDSVDVLYLCKYGQTSLPICPDLGHIYCKLKSQKSKKCDLRPFVNYEDYESLFKQSARKDERIRELEIKLKHKKNSYKREKEVKELSISRWEEDVESYEKKLSQIVELTDKTENIYEILKDMDFEKRSRFFIARTSNNTKYDLWEFKNFIFSFIQPIYEQHVKHLQQIKQIVQGEW